MKAVSKLIAMIIGNTAAIGFGIGMYEGKPVYSMLACIIAALACFIEWRAEK